METRRGTSGGRIICMQNGRLGLATALHTSAPPFSGARQMVTGGLARAEIYLPDARLGRSDLLCCPRPRRFEAAPSLVTRQIGQTSLGVVALLRSPVRRTGIWLTPIGVRRPWCNVVQARPSEGPRATKVLVNGWG